MEATKPEFEEWIHKAATEIYEKAYYCGALPITDISICIATWYASYHAPNGCPMAEPTCPLEPGEESLGYCDAFSFPHYKDEGCRNWRTTK